MTYSLTSFEYMYKERGKMLLLIIDTCTRLCFEIFFMSRSNLIANYKNKYRILSKYILKYVLLLHNVFSDTIICSYIGKFC